MLAPALLVGLLCVGGLALAQQAATIDDGLGGSIPAAASPPIDFIAAESPASNASTANSYNGSFGPLSPGNTTAPAGEARRLKLQGVATVAYSSDPITAYGAVTLGCSLGFVSPTFQSNYIGVSSDFFANSATCGRCVKLQVRAVQVHCMLDPI